MIPWKRFIGEFEVACCRKDKGKSCSGDTASYLKHYAKIASDQGYYKKCHEGLNTPHSELKPTKHRRKEDHGGKKDVALKVECFMRKKELLNNLGYASEKLVVRT